MSEHDGTNPDAHYDGTSEAWIAGFNTCEASLKPTVARLTATLAARDAEVAGLKAEVERLRAESDGWRDKWARSDEGSEILQQHLADARADIEILMEAIDQQITATIGPAILTNMDEAAQNEIRLRIERLEEARQRTHTWKQDEATIEAAEALAKKGEASNGQ